jgi:hypothetical protein
VSPVWEQLTVRVVAMLQQLLIYRAPNLTKTERSARTGYVPARTACKTQGGMEAFSATCAYIERRASRGKAWSSGKGAGPSTGFASTGFRLPVKERRLRGLPGSGSGYANPKTEASSL